MLNNIVLRSALQFKDNIKISHTHNIFKYFKFLTTLYSKYAKISFIKSVKTLKDTGIYESMYFSNYFHDLQTKIFENKIFASLSIKFDVLKDIMDNFLLLLEKDIFFKENKASRMFTNDQTYTDK
jgi:hypothetical protein